MSASWLPIRYRDFYDIPRAVIVDFEGATYLFDCPFDHDLDDYEQTYTVYRVPAEIAEEIDRISWVDLGSRCDPIGLVFAGEVEFDSTARKAIHRRVFDRLRLDRDSS